MQLVSNIADRLTTLEGKVGYIGRKMLTAEELEEAGIDADEGAGSSEQEQMGQGG